MKNKVNALFVETNGVYFNDNRIIPYDIIADAFSCRNGLPAICHPPCKRWGRYWGGGPSAKTKRLLGDDSQAFAFCLWYVRTFGGVIEHPEASHAFKYYGIRKPNGKWSDLDSYGGSVCEVYQSQYGHKAAKKTWLYAVSNSLPELIWEKKKGIKIDDGFHSANEARIARTKSDYMPKKRLTQYERLATPKEFKEVLINIAMRSFI